MLLDLNAIKHLLKAIRYLFVVYYIEKQVYSDDCFLILPFS